MKYYSEKLKKNFDTEDELNIAETNMKNEALKDANKWLDNNRSRPNQTEKISQLKSKLLESIETYYDFISRFPDEDIIDPDLALEDFKKEEESLFNSLHIAQTRYVREIDMLDYDDIYKIHNPSHEEIKEIVELINRLNDAFLD